MPVWDVQELHEGRKPSDGSSPSNAVQFVITGEPGAAEEDALVQLRASAPATLGGLKLVKCEITGFVIDGAAGATFLGEASYASGEEAQDKETGESSFSFDTSGGTFHITQSKTTAQTYTEAGAGTAPDAWQVIGATDDGADGADVTIPQYAFTETHYIADADVTDAYKGVLFALTGTINNDDFKGLAPGECLFLGARGSKRGKGDWEITYSFAASPNKTGITIGPITGIAKVGWDYLWVRYQKVPVGAAEQKVVTQKPIAVYVEIVYDAADFSTLGIGTT